MSDSSSVEGKLRTAGGWFFGLDRLGGAFLEDLALCLLDPAIEAGLECFPCLLLDRCTEPFSEEPGVVPL